MATPNPTTSPETNSPVSDFDHCASEKFDYAVVGSSFCAYGFVKKILGNKPDAKILIIEKGCYHPEFQFLCPVCLGEKEKGTENVPWDFKPSGSLIDKVRGVNHFVGGRSSFWKAWCPRPREDEMKGWPENVVNKMLDLFPCAEKLLGVKTVDTIGHPFENLQDTLFDQLQSLNCTNVTRVDHASLALVENDSRYGRYQKFSVVKPLIEIVEKYDNVKLLTECKVTKIITSGEPKVATGLIINQSDLSLHEAKLILAMSTLPSTILVQNSSINVPGIGNRFTGHFASYTYARVRCEEIFSSVVCEGDKPILAALYIAGLGASERQFHIQLNAVAISGNGSQNLDKMRHLLKTPKYNMIETCDNHIVFVCASLGEVDHINPQNKFYHREDGKHILEFEANDNDKELWKTMNETTFKVLEHLSASNKIEYWNSENENWQEERPSRKLIQHKALVHPASTMWIGDDPSSPVDLDYKVRGVDNVYMTGGALWPSAGSWNPTCAMTALSMDLADKLVTHS